MLSISTVARSFAGGRNYNEGRVAIEHGDSGCCLMLSDGAGGHAGGAVAARTTVDKVLDGYCARSPVDAADLTELLLDAHEAVLAAQRNARGRAQAMHEDSDAFLLCTDGWWDCVANREIEAEFARAQSVQGWVNAMANRVAAGARPDHDNYSAIGCWISLVGAAHDRGRLTLGIGK
jgi:serine/threonine protein phosphatase PrpC